MATSETRRLTKADILAADDIEELDVAVPQWGGTVRIRALTMLQVSNCRKRSMRRDPRTGQDEQDQELTIALLLSESLVDPPHTLPEAQAMLTKSAKAVSHIVRAINEASGLTEAAITEADKSNGARPDAGIRVRPGVGVEDAARGDGAADVSP